MKLIVITPSRSIEDETNIVTKLFESGLMTLHLRKPRLSTQQMKEYIKEIPSHFHNRIIIHSHHQLALKFNLKGIHFTSTHLDKKWKYWWIRQRLRLKFGKLVKTRSYRALTQVYVKEPNNYDYYLLGVMFNSLNGKLYNGYYEEGLRAAIKNGSKAIVGRGGTSDKCLALAKEMELKGLVFNTYIWNADSPYHQFLELLRAFKEHGIELE
jgi:thiamine-phosphate pyrophosphorylase